MSVKIVCASFFVLNFVDIFFISNPKKLDIIVGIIGIRIVIINDII